MSKQSTRMDQKTYTTREAAEKIGITRQGLYLWIRDGKVKAPKARRIGRSTMRFWTAAEITEARKLKGKFKLGRPTKQKKSS